MTMLQVLGYAVLNAHAPGEALRLAEEQYTEIHLLLTDIVMPEMNGRDIADRLRKIRPGIKNLFMSGYMANIIGHEENLEQRCHFLKKPFSIR